MDKIRLVIVDDHEIVRLGLTALLMGNDHFEIIGSVGSNNELLDFLKNDQPDLILLDINLPGISGLECLKNIKKHHHEIKVLMISANVNAHFIESSIKNGAHGYLHKDCTKEELWEALETVARDQMYFSKTISPSVYESLAAKLRNASSAMDLSDREIEVLIGFAEGHSYAEIAENLSISKKTVEAHKKSIYDKLGFKSNADLVKYAIKHRFVEL
ncbi:MAG: response regulator transcription factor [Ekhidna sp.]|uniref:response regulator transcription factor n=1 Tax=Ekhidna sp. TaxID=2608089 RepID=UPI0032EF119B